MALGRQQGGQILVEDLGVKQRGISQHCSPRKAVESFNLRADVQKAHRSIEILGDLINDALGQVVAQRLEPCFTQTHVFNHGVERLGDVEKLVARFQLLRWTVGISLYRILERKRKGADRSGDETA